VQHEHLWQQTESRRLPAQKEKTKASECELDFRRKRRPTFRRAGG
jgi:hypothetical protein